MDVVQDMVVPSHTDLSAQSSHPTVMPTMSDLSVSKESSQIHPETIEVLPHRSHDPANNLKRTDPFKFGSRYLQENDDVFEFNAWDHVVPDESYYKYAETQYNFQRASPVSDFDKRRFNDQPEKWWNTFYSNNTSNFFKDRKWLHQEFPVLSRVTKADSPPAVVLEVGAGAGNTAFPILKSNENPRLMVHACDFSTKAVELLKANEAYDSAHIRASIWDISGESLPDGVQEESVDVVILVFIFSALNPKQWDSAVKNVWKVLKSGGEVCFRDYGKGDLTQVRFKKGRLMEDNFYIRGDGTRVYFFEEAELRNIWAGGIQSSRTGHGYRDNDVKADCEDRSLEMNGDSKVDNEESESKSSEDHSSNEPTYVMPNIFDIVSLGIDRRMLVNRQKQLKMYRCWMQGRFRKPKASDRLS